MNFSPPERRKPQENLLPMINVVFLLLIFFLISARLTPPEPFPVAPPEAETVTEAQSQGEFTLFLSQAGELGYLDQLGDVALTDIAAARTEYCGRTDCEAEPPRLTLRADRAMSASQLAALMPRLSGLGFKAIELVVAGQSK